MAKTHSNIARGIYAASLTPMDQELNIDHKKLVSHCRWLLNNGCHGIVLMGTTGEANSFSITERMEALDAVIREGIPGNKLLVGTGCCALPDTVKLTKHALSHGVGGVLVLPPFYYKHVDDDGLYRVFAQIIQSVCDDDLKIFLYHFPKMSGISFSIPLIRHLTRDFPKQIVGLKDSSDDLEHMELMRQTFPDFGIFPGNEKVLLKTLREDGTGCISASINLTCGLAAKIYTGIDHKDAEVWQKELNRYRGTIEKYPMIPALKQVLYHITHDETWLYMRPPLVPLKREEAENLIEDLESIGFQMDY